MASSNSQKAPTQWHTKHRARPACAILPNQKKKSCPLITQVPSHDERVTTCSARQASTAESAVPSPPPFQNSFCAIVDYNRKTNVASFSRFVPQTPMPFCPHRRNDPDLPSLSLIAIWRKRETQEHPPTPSTSFFASVRVRVRRDRPTRDGCCARPRYGFLPHRPSPRCVSGWNRSGGKGGQGNKTRESGSLEITKGKSDEGRPPFVSLINHDALERAGDELRC